MIIIKNRSFFTADTLSRKGFLSEAPTACLLVKVLTISLPKMLGCPWED